MIHTPASRHLLWQLVRRDLAARYRGSLLGVVWMLAAPLLMLLVYSFVFGVVFQAKWGVDVHGQAVPFPLLLFSGLILHAVLAEALPRAATLIRAHPNYVRKVVFPVELLPVMATCSAFSLLAIQFALLVAACAVYGIYPAPHWLWLIPLLLPYVLLVLGLCWLVALLGVFLPDLQHIIGLLVTVLLFLSPVFYAVEMLPPPWRPVLYWNPLTLLIENTRAVLFYGRAPDAEALLMLWGAGAGVAALGCLAFQRAKAGFADVL